MLCERGGGAAACTRVEGGACGRGRARYLRRLDVEDTPNGEEADSGSGRVPIGDDSKVGDDPDRWVPCISGSKGRGGTLRVRAGLAAGPRPSGPGRMEEERDEWAKNQESEGFPFFFFFFKFLNPFSNRFEFLLNFFG